MRVKNRFFELKEVTPQVMEYTIFNVTPTKEEINELTKAMDDVLADKSRVASIFVLDKMRFLKADHLITIGNWMKKEATLINEKTICVGYKTDGILGKIVLNGIFLVQKPEFEYMISSQADRLIDWINTRVESENIILF
jgi:hypothetical protein